jgi:hypothetical protein
LKRHGRPLQHGAEPAMVEQTELRVMQHWPEVQVDPA